jgi:ABC-type Fe3+ transport system substrate-binding protein
MPDSNHHATVSRRAVLAAGALLAAPSLLSRRAAAAETCVVGTWGGDYARLLRENIDDPILKPLGVNVIQDVGDEVPRLAKMTAQRKLPHGTMDIACLGAVNGYRATSADLVELLDPTEVPNLQHVVPELRMPGFVPHIYSAQVILYNPATVQKPPQSFGELLDPKWKGKIVKAHPGYSGTILTATYQCARELGWGYFEKLAQQNILQVQSAADPPKKIALGERAVQADGVEYIIFAEKESGQPVEPVYATEGTPLIVGPNGVFKAAPNPNAARLFQSFCFTPECQQLCINIGGLRSAHPQAKEKPGRTPLSQIKLMKDDPAAVLKQGEELKAHYVKLFHV